MKPARPFSILPALPAIFLLAVLAGGGARAQSAQEPLSGARFDAYTRGKTLTYSQGGASYGTEQYKGDHRVIWAFDKDQCLNGVWHEKEPGLICFQYENRPDIPQCWHFYKTASGLRAVFVGGENGTELYEAAQSDKPLLCPGPRVGA